MRSMEKRLPELNRQSPDTVLLLHIQDRNPFAFELLYERYRKHAAAFAQRMLGDDVSSASAVKECLLRAAAKRDSYRKGSSVLTWLFRIFYHVCLERFSRGKASRNPAARLPVEFVVQAFDRLNPEHRALVVMQKYHNLSYNNIADVIGKKPSWVKWQMKVAYDLLGLELQNCRKAAPGKADNSEPRKRKAKKVPAAKAGGS